VFQNSLGIASSVSAVKAMHILFLTDNFPPEGNAPATRTFEHARVWVAEGHKVTVITCAPNFPEGIVYEGYKNFFYAKENISGIEVRRVKTYITANEGFVKRSLDYISFMFSSFTAGLFVKRPDVVVATSPQFFCACSGWALSFVRRKPFVFELRDIWPASIAAVGASSSTRLIRVLEAIELFLYRRAALIVSVTNSFKEELAERGIDPNKISVVLNGVDLNQYTPQARDEKLAKQYNLGNRFVVAYVGTHGLAHALDTLVRTAELMRDNTDVVFLFAGGGARADAVAEQVKNKELSNVIVLGRQQKSLMPSIWSLCDASIVHLKNASLFRKVIPSKIFESFAMGLPVLIGVPEGEATALVRSNKAGIVFEPENADDLCSAVTQLIEDRELREQLRLNCENAAKKYDREKLALDMMRLLEQVTGKQQV